MSSLYTEKVEAYVNPPIPRRIPTAQIIQYLVPGPDLEFYVEQASKNKNLQQENKNLQQVNENLQQENKNLRHLTHNQGKEINNLNNLVEKIKSSLEDINKAKEMDMTNLELSVCNKNYDDLLEFSKIMLNNIFKKFKN